MLAKTFFTSILATAVLAQTTDYLQISTAAPIPTRTEIQSVVLETHHTETATLVNTVDHYHTIMPTVTSYTLLAEQTPQPIALDQSLLHRLVVDIKVPKVNATVTRNSAISVSNTLTALSVVFVAALICI